MMEHGFLWFDAVPVLRALGEYEHLIMSWVLMGLLLLCAVWVRRRIAAAPDPTLPDPGLSVRNVAEAAVGVLRDLSEQVVGHGGARYLPLFGSFFLFILAANLVGLIPGFNPPTSNFNVTFALGTFSFLAYNFCGIREHGARYIKQFLGPMLVIAPLILVIEFFGHLFRPISLAIRLFGNMFADHLVLSIFTGLAKVPFLPVPLYFLGALVSVVQAAVFTILTMIYVALAVSHEH